MPRTRTVATPPDRPARQAGSISTCPPVTLTIAGATAYSGVSRTRLYQWAADGTLKFRRAGRRTLVVRSELDAVIASLPPAPIRQRPPAESA